MPRLGQPNPSLLFDDPSLIYGEANFNTIGWLIQKIKYKYGVPGTNFTPEEGILQRPNEGIFVDIGSGTGKAVIAAYATHNFKTLYGIEILEGLHNTALELLELFQLEVRVCNDVKCRRSKNLEKHVANNSWMLRQNNAFPTLAKEKVEEV